jgi:hypothetical protein
VTPNDDPLPIILMFGTRWERIAPESLFASGQRFVHGRYRHRRDTVHHMQPRQPVTTIYTGIKG